jgi:hypothetical protein
MVLSGEQDGEQPGVPQVLAGTAGMSPSYPAYGYLRDPTSPSRPTLRRRGTTDPPCRLGVAGSWPDRVGRQHADRPVMNPRCNTSFAEAGVRLRLRVCRRG